MVQAALQSTQQHIIFPQALLHQAHSLDQQGAQLLAHRGQGILAGLAGLQAYSAALRLVLGQGYCDSSHHSQWACALNSAAESNKAEVGHLVPKTICLNVGLVTWVLKCANCASCCLSISAYFWECIDPAGA